MCNGQKVLEIPFLLDYYCSGPLRNPRIVEKWLLMLASKNIRKLIELSTEKWNSFPPPVNETSTGSEVLSVLLLVALVKSDPIFRR